MQSFLKRFLVIVLIFFVSLLALSAVVAALFEDKIGGKIISEVNKQLKSELEVQDFNLTVIRSFPNVAANLEGVVLHDSRDGVLLESQTVSFRMGLFSLLSSSIKIKSVVVSDGALNIRIDKRGQPNYDILVESETEEEPAAEDAGGPSISLDNARLKDIELNYVDESAGQEIALNVNDANFSGEFSNSQFSMDSEAVLESRFIEISGERYLTGKKLGYDARVFVDMELAKYELEDVKMNVESNIFRVDGSIEQLENATFLDLFLTSEETTLASMLELLPEKYLESFSDFKSSGKFVAKAQLKGSLSDNANPEIKVEVTLDDGSITSDKMDGALRDVSFLATFENGRYKNNRTSVFEVKDFKGYFNRQLMGLGLRVENIDDPDIDFNMNGILPLDVVYGLFGDERITAGSGQIEIKNLTLKGRYKDMINTSRISRVQAGGEIEFDDASLTINKEKMILDRGRLQLKDNLLNIDGLKLEGAGSEMTFTGTAYNFIPVLFADSLNTNRAELDFQASLDAEILDVDRLAGISLVSEEDAAEAQKPVGELKEDRIQARERVSSFLKGTFNANVKAFNYNLIEGEAFVGRLRFGNNELDIDGETRSMGGRFTLDGKMYFEDQPHLSAKLVCEGIDVYEFFRQSENFGQEVLLAKNVSGSLDAKIAIYAYWDQQGNFLYDKLRVLAGIGIKEGELKNFAMLESFSTFVNIRDLREIRFTNMENFLEIRNERVYIPVMFIQSNALNMTVSGEHSFEQEIAYYIKVNAGQVLANRFRSHDPDLAPKPAQRQGFFNLYYSVLGHIDDYVIKSAKRQVKSDFELSEKRKNDIRRDLEREFGIVEMIQEPLDWRDIPEYQGDDDPNDVEFLDWEKEGGSTGEQGRR